MFIIGKILEKCEREREREAKGSLDLAVLFCSFDILSLIKKKAASVDVIFLFNRKTSCSVTLLTFPFIIDSFLLQQLSYILSTLKPDKCMPSFYQQQLWSIGRQLQLSVMHLTWHSLNWFLLLITQTLSFGKGASDI